MKKSIYNVAITYSGYVTISASTEEEACNIVRQMGTLEAVDNSSGTLDVDYAELVEEE